MIEMQCQNANFDFIKNQNFAKKQTKQQKIFQPKFGFFISFLVWILQKKEFVEFEFEEMFC